ncbi:MAG TPA: endonuclease III domain-containing protein [Candidatus Tripitaka californicus]|uniref:endonuclease III domain-containing protein n=1 Tax=Candidatus Tripitaka californicus TaxID=3367616 RepID=UPI00402675A6
MDISRVLAILKQENKKYREPAVSVVARSGNSSKVFKVLVSCLLSLRTKDLVTSQASERLFSLAESPEEMTSLDVSTIERAIYPVGFYKTKARRIKEISRVLMDKYHGKVPDTLEELLELNGVGRKTANLVVTVGYGKPGICVDTHVHRIVNRLGYVSTRTPQETEFALREILPRRYWISINDLLVTHGQNICAPVSPRCSICPVEKYCQKVGVSRHR